MSPAEASAIGEPTDNPKRPTSTREPKVSTSTPKPSTLQAGELKPLTPGAKPHIEGITSQADGSRCSFGATGPIKPTIGARSLQEWTVLGGFRKEGTLL